MKKLISNVVNLDMTNATPESIKGVRIKNAVNVFVTPTTRSLVGEVNFGNIVRMIEIPEGANLSMINGDLVIDGSLDTLKGAYFLLNGDVIVKNDVSVETLIKFFACGASINGNIILPDTIASPISQLNVRLNGDISPYPADSLLFMNINQINNGFLSGLPIGAKVSLVPNGDLFISDETNTEAFAGHISELYVYGDVVLPSQLSDVFYKVTKKYSKITTVPEGFAFYDKKLIVSPSNLISLKGKRLYTRNSIILKNGINEQRIRQMEFKLDTPESVIFPDYLTDVVIDKVTAKDYFAYRGQLITVSGEMKISKADTEELASYLVKSDAQLSFNDDVTADEIGRGIGEIFLYGHLTFSEKQARFVYEKIVVDKGDAEIIYAEDKAGTEENNNDSVNSEYDVVIANAVEYSL